MRIEFSQEVRVWGALVVLSLVLLLVDGMGWFGLLKRTVENAMSPMKRGGLEVVLALESPFEVVWFYRNGVSRIADLESRLAERFVDQDELLRLKQENQRMKELLGVPLPASWKFSLGHVLAQNEGNLTIDIGLGDGLKQGMTVVLEDMLVGRVVRVSQSQSVVMTVGADQSVVAARVGEVGARGQVSGDGKGVVLGQLLQEADVGLGDAVFTSGSDGLLPGLLVGRVVEVSEVSSNIYRQAQVEMLLPREIDVVFVIVEE